MEAVRGDWTDLARSVQRELYARLFADRPVLEYLREVVADLRRGRFDDQLVYRKSLRKAPEAYTATTPPHVAAARKMAGKRRGRVAYVITTDGPEPADDRRHPIDHEHYVEKQLRAVAEPVLALLGPGLRRRLRLEEAALALLSGRGGDGRRRWPRSCSFEWNGRFPCASCFACSCSSCS